jgi:beta-lactam-binding protein with PASTA domain
MSAASSVGAAFAARCIVPKTKGKALRAAKRAVIKAHCKVGTVKKAFSAKVRKGRVTAQSAKPGKRLAPGAKIRLTVSKGKRP